ncbi:MAG TPA: hypothetical protein VMO47_07425 [Rhodothermales bacterium]|nr:hypothetical protein [Rhodothermales bacterium]
MINKFASIFVLSGLSWAIAPVAFSQAPACSSEEKSHQFDFWIGDWEVTAGGKVAGHNLIEPILDGCVIQENWTGAGGSAGSSFNFYNPQTDGWEQFWVWRNGTTIHTKGGYSDGKMVLEGETTNQQGQSVLNRITWHDNDDGTVRQHWQMSSDGGETWTDAFDGLYTKR